ncbi:hypothetical protein [Clostridium minihomine]|uniref:hypothetical protein n=1 Tax=Clostridium minihomine TaxID=2045012 RepID=UPI000C76E748|nr:hypothetical protein [Clostridium minihomine]
MNQKEFVRRMLRQYGAKTMVRCRDAEPVCAYALIQAMGVKHKAYPEDVWLPEGYYDNSHFFYLGPADCRLDQMKNAVVSQDDGDYMVIRSRGYWMQNQLLYVWAVLREMPKEEIDDGI